MMACNCSDTAAGVRVLCAYLPISGVPYSSQPSDYLAEVLFPDEVTQAMMTCSGIDIYVHSARFPFTRYDTGSSGQGSTDCIARGNCRSVDATVWLFPRCEQLPPRACLPTATCFPFCMAARPSGSGASNLIFTPASRWRSGYTIMQQDCAIATAQPDDIQDRLPSTGVASASSTRQSFPTFALSATASGCRRAPSVVSIVDKQEGGMC